MPGDDEKKAGMALRQSAATPNEERSVPRHVRRIQRADPLWAKYAAGALTLTLTTTSAGVASTDSFLNSTSRINNGVTMPATQIEAPQGLRASAEDVSRLSSDANVSRIAQSGNQNLLLTRVNDLLAALDGTGQPFRREMLLGGVRDQQAWADRYSTLTEAQKRVFIDQAIVILAENFGDQFSTGQAVRINEAFGGIVQQNLDPMFAQATSPVEAQVAATPVPWYQQIPVVREIASLFIGAQVIPTPAGSVTIEGEGGQQVTITDNESREMLLAMGVPAEMIDSMLTEDKLPALLSALCYMNEFTNNLNALFRNLPEGTLPEEVDAGDLREAWERAVYASASFAATNYPEYVEAQGIDPANIQRAGLPVPFVSAILINGLSWIGELVDAANNPSEAGRQRAMAQVLNGATGAAQRARVTIQDANGAQVTTTAAEAQASYDKLKGEVDALRTELQRYEGILQGSRRGSPAEVRAQAQLTDIEGKLNAKETELAQAERMRDSARAGSRVMLDALVTGLNGGATAPADPVHGRIGTILRAAGFNPDEILRGMNGTTLDATLAARAGVVQYRINPLDGSVTADFGEAFRPSSSVWGRMFADPFRMVSGSGSTGLGLARVAAIPYRITRSILTETFRGATTPYKVAGGSMLLLMVEGGMAFDYWTGISDWRDPVSYIAGLRRDSGERQPAQSRAGAATTTAATGTTQIERDALTAATAFRTSARELGNSSFSNLREELSLFEEYILGTKASLEGDAVPQGTRSSIVSRRGSIEAAQAFLDDFKNRSAGLGQDQAALLFYKMFFEKYGPSGLASVIEAYIPDAERVGVYSYLFSQAALKSPTRPVLDAALFDKLRAQSSFNELVGPLMEVVEASLNLEGARSRRAGAAGPAAYLDALVATLAVRERLGGTPNPQTVALAIAEQKLSGFTTTIRTIRASLDSEPDRLDAYIAILKLLPEDLNISDANLERQFLLQQLDRYPNLRSAVETYFYSDDTNLRAASIYIIQLIRDAASEPGVSARGPTEVDVENLLRRRLSQNQSADIRNLLDVIYIAEERRGRVQFDANKFTMLVDAAIFLSVRPTPASPSPTAPQLQQYFITEFNNRYGVGLFTAPPSTVQDDKQFDFVVALLPLRDSRGATLSPEAMMERANGTEYWSYRTDEWLRANFAALPAAERASSFISLPEALQIEYWNAHPDEREDLYTAAKRDRTWNSAHGTDLRGRRETRGRGRSRTTVTVYPEWE